MNMTMATSGRSDRMRRRFVLLVLGAGAGTLASVGCVNLKAPENVSIRAGNRPERVDPGEVPRISSVEEGRTELHRAYRYIRYLERENAELEEENDELERELDRYD